MNNEIKEIIDMFTKYKDDWYSFEYKLKPKQCVAVLDYITNLKQKVEQYENPDDMTLFYMWLDAKAKDKMKQLQEENERLKEENILLKASEPMSKLAEDYGYKSRCEKAIELVNEMLERAYINGEYILYDYSTSEILEIKEALNGGDEE